MTRRHTRTSILTLFPAVPLLFGAACQDELTDDLAGVERAAALPSSAAPGADAAGEDTRPYRHPLARAADEHGLMYASGSLDAPDGRRLLVEEGRFVSESGQRLAFSGVSAAERRRMDASERAALATDKERLHGAERLQPSPVRKIGPVLEELLAEHEAGRAVAVGAEQGIEVVIALARPERVPLFEELEQAVARGLVRTRADRDRVRESLARARRADIVKAGAPVVEAVGRAGGAVSFRGQNTHILVAQVPVGSVRALATRTDIARVELFTADDDEVEGDDVIKGHQIEQFVNAGYDGENDGNSYDITFAQVEGGGAHNEHLGYRDGTGTATRIRGLLSCSGFSCSSISDFGTSQESDHASSVAGIIFGDLLDGQDSGQTSATARLERSGYAGEARAWLYAGASTLAFDHIAGRTDGTAPAVVNMSAGAATADPTCLGRDSRAIAANEMFEAGKLLIKSAGNEYHSSTTDCTVTAPGSGIGVFSVASVGSSSTGTETTVRGATVSSFSSRGGTSSEGAGRKIIDIAAYGYRRMLYDTAGGYTRSGGGTSYAAPTVTATALDFIDFYKHEYSDLIDNPGFLAADLLLMGDRTTDTATRATAGFDNLYGAGRLRARRFDAAGMDAPWGFANGSVCIDDGEVYTIDINKGAALSTDVDSFQAVLWWYDSRHESDGTLDDIDLRLKTAAGTSLRSSVSLDNKERVYHDGVGGQAVKLEIVGYRATADNMGCGTNSMKVYYAYFYEDSDRDDADGPGAEIDPE